MSYDGKNGYLYEAQGWLYLVKCSVNGTQFRYQYYYDAEGHLVTLATQPAPNCYTSTTTVSDFRYDQAGHQTVEIDANLHWKHTNVYANGELLATYDPAGLHYALPDWLGDKRLQASAKGVAELDCWNLPYNELYGCSGTDATEHRYTGKEHDPYTSLDLFGAREYTNFSGRFLSQDDPFVDQSPGDPQSWNLYGYARNNPLTNTDPSGQDCVTQTRTSSSSESVSVNTGNCSGNVGDGQSQTYVNGTITGVQAGADGHSIDIGSTNSDGSTGVTNASSAPTPDNPGIAFGYNQAGYNQLANASRGVSAVAGVEMSIMAPWAGAAADCMSGASAGGCAGSMAMALLPEVGELRAGAQLLKAGRGLNAAEILGKTGGFAQALKDFEALPGKETILGDMRAKTLLDGTRVTVRDFSKAGPPTLELHAPSGVVTKYRY